MAACSSIRVARWNSRDARSRCSSRARAAARALRDSAVAWAATVSSPPTTTPMKAQTAVLTAPTRPPTVKTRAGVRRVPAVPPSPEQQAAAEKARLEREATQADVQAAQLRADTEK